MTTFNPKKNLKNRYGVTASATSNSNVNIGVKASSTTTQGGFIFAPYITAENTASMSLYEEYLNRCVQKKREEQLEILLD